MSEKYLSAPLEGDHETARVFSAICRLLGESMLADGLDLTTMNPPGATEVNADNLGANIEELVRKGHFRIVMKDDESFKLEPTERGHRQISSSNEIVQWMKGTLRLERATGTKAHDFQQALRSNQLQNVKIKDGDAFFESGWDSMGVFVVEHDWAAAFASADIGAVDERKLPYPLTCFEMVISGHRVCAFAREADDGWVIAVQTPFGWWLLNDDMLRSEFEAETNEVASLVEAQADAILVALDSAVATTEIVRAPEKLNRARVKRGNLPLYDYHAVKLSRRSRPLPLPPTDGSTRHGVRLHFRRGHWRHLTSHKVWINWTLVGDPDLGFIDKHYRL